MLGSPPPSSGVGDGRRGEQHGSLSRSSPSPFGYGNVPGTLWGVDSTGMDGERGNGIMKGEWGVRGREEASDLVRISQWRKKKRTWLFNDDR